MRVPITGNRAIDEATIRALMAAEASARSFAKWRKDWPVLDKISKKYARLRWKVGEMARIARA